MQILNFFFYNLFVFYKNSNNNKNFMKKNAKEKE